VTAGVAHALGRLPQLAELRSRLEYAIWQVFPAASGARVDYVLDAADAYAAGLAEVLPAARLAEASAEYFGGQP